MEKKFENRDFEDFVKQNADQYRMFPSEKVWKGIDNTINKRRRWYGIGLAFLLITTATVTGIMLNPSSNKYKIASSEVKSTSLKNDLPQKIEPTIVLAPIKPAAKKLKNIITPDNTQKNLFAISANQENETYTKNNISNYIVTTQIKKTDQPEGLMVTPEKKSIIDRNTNITLKEKTNKSLISDSENAVANTSENLLEIADDNETIENKIIENSPNLKEDIYPMTIESVLNTYQNVKKSKKLVWQLYVTPLITYRKLDDNKPFLDAARSIIGTTGNYSLSDINNSVIHKPDVGIQAGFSAGYPISKNITLKAGLQLNVSRYNIRASAHTSEIATIALNTPGGGTNTISAVTNYRNVTGYRASWLHNKYISASIPIGAELKFSGNRKTIIGIGATVEPTYVLGNRAYLLSTDLKNYAVFPSLTRKWNFNTGFEIFAGYNTGKLDWRIGPQVRYQVFSSFYNKYPIKEHLFDFGIKLGLTLK